MVLERLFDTKVKSLSIITVELKEANKEYAWQIPQGIKRFSLKVRDGTSIRISTQKGMVAGKNEPYFIMPTGASWVEEDLHTVEEKFIYMASPVANKIVEIQIGV